MSPVRRSRALGAYALGGGLGLALAVIAVACGRTPGLNRPPRESLLEKSQADVAFQSPALWRYHPRSEASLLARYEVSPGVILYCGERGERWLFDRAKKSVRAAARLAPEALIAVLRTEDGGWLFVGETGTGYEAREALGPFVRTSAPIDKLSRVSAAGKSLVGVTRDGQLVDSEDAGASWKQVGAKDTRFVDVMLADTSRGLALSVPEAAWETKDGGSTWTKLDAPSVGAIALGWDDKLGVAVQTALGWLRWDPSGKPELAPLGRSPAKGRFKLPIRPVRGPDAVALSEGRALLLGAEYLEVARAEAKAKISAWRTSAGERWVLWRGQVSGRLVEHPLDVANGCHAVRIAARGSYLYLACVKSSVGANQEFSFYRSEDAGKKFKEDLSGVEGRQSELEMAVGPGGELVLSGVCAPQNSARGCLPYGIYHRRKAPADGGVEGGAGDGAADAGKAKKDTVEYELGPSAAPALKGSALARRALRSPSSCRTTEARASTPAKSSNSKAISINRTTTAGPGHHRGPCRSCRASVRPRTARWPWCSPGPARQPWSWWTTKGA
jgi:hypothetical protein